MAQQLDAGNVLSSRSLFERVPDRFRAGWLRMLYCPPPWAVLINPYFIVRRGLYAGIKRGCALAHGRVLDFGAGSAPYRDLIGCDEYVTVDIDSGGHPSSRKVAAVYYDGHSLPFASAHFDFILCSEVLEHVFNPDEVLAELQRVLKPGGRILVTVPFVWEEHECPYDFARYSSFGLPYLLERHGFATERSEKTSGYLATLFQMAVVYLISRKVFVRFRYLKLVAAPILFAPILLIGMALDALCPRDDRLYHNNVVLARKL
jgi:SAM-dependent methyltransferase